MMGYWGWGFPDKPIRKNGKMSDDLTTAYLLGAEAMRSKLHKQADEIECLRKALKNILDDATNRNPVRMTFEVSDKVLVEAEAALHDKNV